MQITSLRDRRPAGPVHPRRAADRLRRDGVDDDGRPARPGRHRRGADRLGRGLRLRHAPRGPRRPRRPRRPDGRRPRPARGAGADRRGDPRRAHVRPRRPRAVRGERAGPRALGPRRQAGRPARRRSCSAAGVRDAGPGLRQPVPARHARAGGAGVGPGGRAGLRRGQAARGRAGARGRGPRGGRRRRAADAGRQLRLDARPRRVAAARELQPYGLGWVEEPVWPPEDLRGLRGVREQGGVPVAAGENAGPRRSTSARWPSRAAATTSSPA